MARMDRYSDTPVETYDKLASLPDCFDGVGLDAKKRKGRGLREVGSVRRVRW
jgi:hypothetical protein